MVIFMAIATQCSNQLPTFYCVSLTENNTWQTLKFGTQQGLEIISSYKVKITMGNREIDRHLIDQGPQGGTVHNALSLTVADRRWQTEEG